MNLHPALEQAQQLLQQTPLPEDAEAQLKALQRKVPKEQRNYFSDIWSSYEMLRRDQGYVPEL